MRLAPVTCCISSFTPSDLATMPASSMSKPSGSRLCVLRAEGRNVERGGDAHRALLDDVLEGVGLRRGDGKGGKRQHGKAGNEAIRRISPSEFPNRHRFQITMQPEEAMTAPSTLQRPLPGAAFGATVRLSKPLHEGMPDGLPQALADAGGLLLLPGLDEITKDPRLLVTMSYLFGPEVEDYRTLLTRVSTAHDTVPEIFMVTNMVPNYRQPPARPEPPLTADGKFPVQYPHRKGWHTDQSYRRPPPDISLFYAVTPVAKDRGQTHLRLGHAGLRSVAGRPQGQGRDLQGLHCQPGTGRGRTDAEAGKTPPAILPHQRSQPQPVVRTHPVTGRKALYLCERSQMDWFDGPFVGMEPGPYGEGAQAARPAR